MAERKDSGTVSLSHIKEKTATVKSRADGGHTSNNALVAKDTQTDHTCSSQPSPLTTAAHQEGCGGKLENNIVRDVDSTSLHTSVHPPQQHSEPLQEANRHYNQETGNESINRQPGTVAGCCEKQLNMVEYKRESSLEDGSKANLTSCAAVCQKGLIGSSKESSRLEYERKTVEEKMESPEGMDESEASTVIEDQPSLNGASPVPLTLPKKSPPYKSTSNLPEESEVEIVSVAATDRSVAWSMRPHPPTRPNTLHVSAAHGGEGGGEEGEGDMFARGEEERTPDGGRVREFVGHPYKSASLNNGEVVVTPEKSLTPPNMVSGLFFPLEQYRRQFSGDNNHDSLSYLLSREREGAHGGVALLTTETQNSEPARILDRYTYRDNNGVSYTTNRPYSHSF